MPVAANMPIICFGECLIDFLNHGKVPDGSLSLNQFTQYPGGAPANAAVAVARLGGNARFLGQVGSDIFGDFLIDALRQYGVDTSLARQHPTAPTALAFVFLDDKGDRQFQFLRHGSADMVLAMPDLDAMWPQDLGIFHFCSNTLTEAPIAAVTSEAVRKAGSAGALISFDVNLRANLWPGGNIVRERVNALVKASHVLKFAREELMFLSGGAPEAYLQDLVASGVKLALITDGGEPVQYVSQVGTGQIDCPPVSVVDTTGGGDAFSGGMLFGLAEIGGKGGLDRLCDDDRALKKLVMFAARCGAHAVSRPGAFPAMPTFQDVASHWINDD